MSDDAQSLVLAEVRRVVADVAGVPLRTVEPQMRLHRGMGIDSVRLVEIVVALEERFDLRLPEEHFSDELTIGGLAALVESLGAKGVPSAEASPPSHGTVATNTNDKLIGPSAIDCYVGAHVESLRRRGFSVAEVDALVMGGGFRFKIIEDEEGLLELTFPWVETVEGFASTCKAPLVRETPPLGTPSVDAIASFVSRHGGVVLWVNTKDLPYLTDPISKDGYMHAVLVHSVNAGRAVVVDCFVPRGEMVTLESEQPLETIARAFSERIEGNPYDQVGRFEIIATPSAALPSASELARRTVAQLADGEHRTLDVYFRRSTEALSGYSPAERARFFKLWAYEINTDHVLPNRLLLKQAVDRYFGSGTELAARAEGAVRAWRALGMSLQRMALHGEDRDGVLAARTSDVLAAEEALALEAARENSR